MSGAHYKINILLLFDYLKELLNNHKIMDTHKQLNAETTTWLYEWYFWISNLSDFLFLFSFIKNFQSQQKLTENIHIFVCNKIRKLSTIISDIILI